jgi:hypothetical protein
MSESKDTLAIMGLEFSNHISYDWEMKKGLEITDLERFGID